MLAHRYLSYSACFLAGVAASLVLTPTFAHALDLPSDGLAVQHSSPQCQIQEPISYELRRAADPSASEAQVVPAKIIIPPCSRETMTIGGQTVTFEPMLHLSGTLIEEEYWGPCGPEPLLSCALTEDIIMECSASSLMPRIRVESYAVIDGQTHQLPSRTKLKPGTCHIKVCCEYLA